MIAGIILKDDACVKNIDLVRIDQDESNCAFIFRVEYLAQEMTQKAAAVYRSTLGRDRKRMA